MYVKKKIRLTPPVYKNLQLIRIIYTMICFPFFLYTNKKKGGDIFELQFLFSECVNRILNRVNCVFMRTTSYELTSIVLEITNSAYFGSHFQVEEDFVVVQDLASVVKSPSFIIISVPQVRAFCDASCEASRLPLFLLLTRLSLCKKKSFVC